MTNDTNLARESHIPSKASNRIRIAAKDSSLVVYVFDYTDRPYSIGFRGCSNKPLWHGRHKSNEDRQKYVAKWFSSIAASEKTHNDYKAKNREQRKAAHTLKVGDILYTSWGYEQTNVGWYQVTKIVTDKTVEIRKIAGDYDESNGWLSGKTMPKKDHFVGDAFRKRVSSRNTIAIDSYATAYLWEGQPVHWSGYA